MISLDDVKMLAVLTIPTALATGLGAYLLSGKKIFSVQFIAPNTTFAKGAAIGGSIVGVGILILKILDFLNSEQYLPKIGKNKANPWPLLAFVPLIAIPGYVYGRSSPITAISFVALTALGCIYGDRILDSI